MRFTCCCVDSGVIRAAVTRMAINKVSVAREAQGNEGQ